MKPIRNLRDPLKAEVAKCSLTPDGTTLITTNTAGYTYVWDLKAEKIVKTFPHSGYYAYPALSPDGRELLYDEGNNSLKTYDLPSKIDTPILVWGSIIEALQYSPDGRFIGGLVDAKAVHVFDRAFVAALLPLKKGQVLSSFAFSHDSLRVACSSFTHIYIFDVLTGEELIYFKSMNSEPKSILCSPCDANKVICLGHHTIESYDFDIDKLTLHYNESESKINTGAISPDGALLVTGSEDGRLTFFKTDTMDKMHTIKVHKGGILSCTFSNDGNLIITSSRDGTVRFWRRYSKM